MLVTGSNAMSQLTLSPSPAAMKDATDVQEFQQLYREKFGLIYRYVYRKVGNREDAEDLTSEIFLKAVGALNQEFSPQSMHKWLFLIARATVADYWRTHYRLPAHSLDELLEAGWEGPAEEEPAVAAISSGPAERVQHLLQALPEQYREVLICRFLLNLSIKATALRMGLTEANIKVLQFRALKRAATLEQANPWWA
jgi:RNA polymerase sigma-70 factor (ECF subfamily)